MNVFDIIVVDDHPIVAEALTALLAREPALRVVKCFITARGLLDYLQSHPADLVLLDLSMRSGDGIELIKAIRATDADQKILVFSMHDEGDYAPRAIAAGARGYVMKDHAADRLIEAVFAVLGGKIHCSENVRHFQSAGDGDGGPRELTDREYAVYEMLGRGLATRQIALFLHLSPKTVEKHRENIKRKLHIDNTPKLIASAARWVVSREGPLQA